MDGGAPAQETGSQPTVKPGDATRCHGCAAAGDSFSEPLKKCSGCGKAWYHSQDCQRNHWKAHKPTCLASRPKKANTVPSSNAEGTEFDAHKYYNTTARSSPEAQKLMSTLCLGFPSSPTQVEGTAKPLRSLIYTGKDTPQNMQLIFGPNWRSSLGKNYDDTRIEVLLDPPRGSPSYALNQHLNLFDPLQRSPRPATESEKHMVTQVREIQDGIRRRIGPGKSPSKEDAEAVLSSYGPNWTSHLQTYVLAINTMDQGVGT